MSAELSSPPPTSSVAQSRRVLLVRGAALAAALGMVAWQQRPNSLLRVIFPAIDGDAIVIQFPDGRFGLIDGGASPAALAVELGHWLPFWQRDLAFVLLTLADSRHLSGQIGALQRYTVLRVLASQAALRGRGATFSAWQALLSEQGLRPEILRPDSGIAIGRTQLQALFDQPNGILLRLVYGTTSIVLAHASDAQSEATFLQTRRVQRADLLAFPWQRDPHTRLVEALRPRWIHFTEGYQSKEPARLTYAEREIRSAQLSHPHVDGAVVWVSDGRRSWVETPNKH